MLIFMPQPYPSVLPVFLEVDVARNVAPVEGEALVGKQFNHAGRLGEDLLAVDFFGRADHRRVATQEDVAGLWGQRHAEFLREVVVAQKVLQVPFLYF